MGWLNRITRGVDTSRENQNKIPSSTLDKVAARAEERLVQLLEQGRLAGLVNIAPQLAATQASSASLGPMALSVLRWQPRGELVQMYDSLASHTQMTPEARLTTRWLSAMHGPQQPIFATYRPYKDAPHAPFALHRSHSVHSSMGAALQSMLPAHSDKGMVTVTVGAPYSGRGSLSLTFHGRTALGFSGSSAQLQDLCEAALLSAWLSDGRHVGAYTTMLLSRFGAGCAEGKSQQAAQYLEESMHDVQSAAQTDVLWQSVDKGTANVDMVMTEHVRALHDKAWWAYAKDHGYDAVRLQEDVSVAMEQDPRWAAEYFNSAILRQLLVTSDARINSLGADVVNDLIERQLVWGTLPG